MFHFDENGKPIQQVFPHSSHLYIEDKDSEDAISIYGTPLKRENFPNVASRKQFIKKNPNIRLFEYINPCREFLLERYLDYYNEKEFAMFPLRTHFLDIEIAIGCKYLDNHKIKVRNSSIEEFVTIKRFKDNHITEKWDVWDEEYKSWKSFDNSCYKDVGEFPDPYEVKYPINVITTYDSYKEMYFTFVLNTDESIEFKSDDKVIYKVFDNEVDMLDAYLEFHQANMPDVITGWNIHGFDIPYIVNRINKIMSLGNASRLSPLDMEPEYRYSFNKENPKEYKIEGISLIDYMKLTKKFKHPVLPSYSLEYVCQHELGEGKISMVDYKKIEKIESEIDDLKKQISVLENT